MSTPALWFGLALWALGLVGGIFWGRAMAMAEQRRQQQWLALLDCDDDERD